MAFRKDLAVGDSDLASEMRRGSAEACVGTSSRIPPGTRKTRSIDNIRYLPTHSPLTYMYREGPTHTHAVTHTHTHASYTRSHISAGMCLHVPRFARASHASYRNPEAVQGRRWAEKELCSLASATASRLRCCGGGSLSGHDAWVLTRSWHDRS